MKVLSFFCAALMILAHSAAMAQLPAPQERLSEFTHDWNNDGTPDHAILVAAAPGAPLSHELRFYLSQNGQQRLAETIPGNWITPPIYATSIEFSLSPQGSLYITDGNQTGGTSRWSDTLTVAYRDNAFVVAGFTFSSGQPAPGGEHINCDVNFLTGKGTLNNKPFTTTAAPVPLKLWEDEKHRPRECPLP